MCGIIKYGQTFEINFLFPAFLLHKNLLVFVLLAGHLVPKKIIDT